MPYQIAGIDMYKKVITRYESSHTGGSRTRHRAFFTVDDDAEIVRVLHVRRGARQRPMTEELRGD